MSPPNALRILARLPTLCPPGQIRCTVALMETDMVSGGSGLPVGEAFAWGGGPAR